MHSALRRPNVDKPVRKKSVNIHNLDSCRVDAIQNDQLQPEALTVANWQNKS